ncbi:DNA hydrolase [Nocardia nova]|uniref:DNA hydrolase n=1 Tax=Nocardia nova TaxID=37330 RepID=A0A2S6AJ86_9NOCA|nr:NUDIX hydrolase [Nocardia nova]PPJ24400.1 DNA hydrolase [Nocardia nova]PPJ35286.1 DNA hydrolase [Nocardia nova]
MEQQSAVSLDVVALRFGADDPAVTFGVAPRQWEPFAGELALPGVLLGRGERLATAARRAVHSKLGVPADATLAVGQLVTFDEPHRDPRGPTLSIAMWAVLADPTTPTGAQWVPFDAVPPLAFDHNMIVQVARERLADMLWKDLAFTRALIGEQFPATRAVALATALSGTRPDPGNLNRTLATIPGLTRTGERMRTKATGRPAAVWSFTDSATSER